MRVHDALYLLRVWRDDDGEDAWRASVKDLRTQETTNFQDLSALLAHVTGGAAEETEEPG